MDYSLNKRKISLGKLKGKEMFVASAVCQKQRVSFDQLCERMAEDSTVGQADVAAVFYKFRNILNRLCSQGYIVDGGPLGTFRPSRRRRKGRPPTRTRVAEPSTHREMNNPPTCFLQEGGLLFANTRHRGCLFQACTAPSLCLLVAIIRAFR